MKNKEAFITLVLGVASICIGMGVFTTWFTVPIFLLIFSVIGFTIIGCHDGCSKSFEDSWFFKP